jgi:cell division protein FtsN
MTDDAKASGPGRRPAPSDFDLVEDIGDAAAFDRALDELLPKGDLAAAGRFDIDPADFEAFNRELDAQMAQVKARSARVDVIEDLGTDVVEPAPAPLPREAPPVPERVGGGVEEPQIAEDVVTLGAAATAPAAAPTTAEPPPPDARSAPPPPAAVTVGAAPASIGRGAALALLVGLGGLVAGGGALWLSLDREAELARLRSALAERRAAPAVPAAPAPSGDAEKVRALEGRLEEVSRRLAELSTSTTPAPGKPPPADTLPVQHEHVAAAPAPAVTQQAAAPAPAAPAAPKLETKVPAKEPKPAVKAVETPATPAQSSPVAPTPVLLAPTAASAPSAGPAPSAESAPPPTAAPTPPVQTLPKPSGHGSWSVVIDSFREESVAEQRSAQITRMGLPAEVRWFMANDQMRYRVVVPGYATRDAADIAAAELRRRKAGSAWVTRLPKQE